MGRSYCIVPVLLCLFYGAWGLSRVDPLVDSKVGLIRGLTAPDGDYSMFLGIPYATVDPLNPFGPSIPHPGFEETFDADDDSIVCPQREEFNNTLVGTLDYLRINVHVPNTASSRNRRPVMVWIHGGAFLTGAGGIYGAKFLVEHDVLVVTFNYRLGAYGFLCPDIPEIPGNQGMKDQLTALRWVKNNIEAFGGDSNKITLFGESAGGVSVDLHLTYTGENLFNNVILQSGSAFLPLAVLGPNPSGPLDLAKQLGFETDDVTEALTFLSTVDTKLVVAATYDANIQPTLCVEKEYENVERFITSHPAYVKRSNLRNVPILMGYNNNELGGDFQMETPKGFEGLPSFWRIAGIFDMEGEYLDDMVRIIRQFYIGDEDISEDVIEQVNDFNSDFYFNYPTYRSMQKYFENGASKIYHYIFSYAGERNAMKLFSNVSNATGAVHADELGYIFDIGWIKGSHTPEDQLTIDRITTLWTNFAKYSDPTPEVTDILPVQWPVVTEDVMNYLEIDSEISIKKRPFHERVAFWDLFFKFNGQFLKGSQEN